MRIGRAFPRLVCGVVVLAIGCAAPSVVPATRPGAVAESPRMRDLLDAPWTVMRPAGSYANDMRVLSELVSRVDSVEQRDSAVTTIAVAWTRLAGGEPARISGLLTDYRTGTAGTAPALPAGLIVPTPFSAAEGRGVTPAQLEVPSSGACGLAAAVLQPVRELFVSTPPGLTVGDTWSDSTNSVICRDSIPLQVSSRRDYRVIGAERRGSFVVLVLDRSSVVTMRGEGRQFGESLSITAEGTGTIRIELDVESGAVVAARGEAELRMQMRGRRRSQDLTQRTRIEISAP